MKQIKSKFYINAQIVVENLNGKHMQNMSLYVQEFSKTKKSLKILKLPIKNWKSHPLDKIKEKV